MVFDCPDVRIHPNMITYRFNEKGEFLLEDELVEVDDITNFVKESIVNERKRKQTQTFYISFQLKAKIKDSIFNKIMENTIDGIYLYYEKLALKELGKNFCELTSLEFKKMTSKFKFAFTSYDILVPRQFE